MSLMPSCSTLKMEAVWVVMSGIYVGVGYQMLVEAFRGFDVEGAMTNRNKLICRRKFAPFPSGAAHVLAPAQMIGAGRDALAFLPRCYGIRFRC